MPARSAPSAVLGAEQHRVHHDRTHLGRIDAHALDDTAEGAFREGGHGKPDRPPSSRRPRRPPAPTPRPPSARGTSSITNSGPLSGATGVLDPARRGEHHAVDRCATVSAIDSLRGHALLRRELALGLRDAQGCRRALFRRTRRLHVEASARESGLPKKLLELRRARGGLQITCAARRQPGLRGLGLGEGLRVLQLGLSRIERRRRCRLADLGARLREERGDRPRLRSRPSGAPRRPPARGLHDARDVAGAPRARCGTPLRLSERARARRARPRSPTATASSSARVERLSLKRGAAKPVGGGGWSACSAWRWRE